MRKFDYMTGNEVFALHEEGKLVGLVEENGIEYAKVVAEGIFSENTVGTCLQTPQGDLEAMGLGHLWKLPEIQEVADECVMSCPVCGWNCAAGEPCCDSRLCHSCDEEYDADEYACPSCGAANEEDE